MKHHASLLAVLYVCAAPPAALAQEDFFKGKNISIIVAGTAGGGLDVSARIMTRHFGPFIPGQPNLIAQLMPGAGGIRAVEYLASAAPQDGTSLITVAAGPILEPLIGTRKTSYRMVDFPAIGAVAKETSVCVAWHASKFSNVADARNSEMIVAGTGAGSSTDIYPVVMNELLGTKFKVITGYQGSQESSIAIERQEVDGRCGWGWTSLKSTSRDWVRDNKLKYLLQFGLTKNPELPGVPLAINLAERQEDKQLMRLLFAPLMLNKPLFAAPGTPPDRVSQLRAAFSAMVASGPFREEVKKVNGEEPDPTSGEDAQALIEEIYETPDAVVSRLKTILK